MTAKHPPADCASSVYRDDGQVPANASHDRLHRLSAAVSHPNPVTMEMRWSAPPTRTKRSFPAKDALKSVKQTAVTAPEPAE